MNNIVSVFQGISPKPIAESDWLSVLEKMQTGHYREAIERGRLLVKDPVAYREFKKKLPAVTFCAAFSGNRDNSHVVSSTGFLIPDLDHLPDVESTFRILCRDENIWFCFRSPSGEGLKCALRAEGIQNDADIKTFFESAQNYFLLTYGLKIDPACKDIARLTFVSHDPKMYISNDAEFFDIRAWAPEKRSEERYIMPDDTNNGWRSKYGNKVLDSCCDKIRQSAKGQQHHERLRQARLVGGFVASGFIDEVVALNALEQAVRDSGAKLMPQAMETVRDGIEYGKKQPITPEPRNDYRREKEDIRYYCDPEEPFESKQSKQSKQYNQSQQSQQSTEQEAEVSNGKQEVSRSKQDFPEKTSKSPQNLAAHILEWIRNSSGSFTTEQLDREFCLTTRIEKNNRSKCLHTLLEKKLINRDRRIKGKYHIVDTTLKVIDIFNTDETAFPIRLPFHLEQNVSVPKKSIIVIAGSSNAGKTALILNTIKMNLPQEYQMLYLMSEMGAGEYVDRIRKFDDIEFKNWNRVIAAERTTGFGDAVECHCKDGLTCIDFLEEVDGEYFKIPTDLRNIYDALGDGVALVAIQKKTDSDYGRGGQATTEKPRLYMAVDLITVQEHCIICALKIIKLKRFIGRNLQGHEIHFRIHGGSKIEAISEWMRSEPGLREKMKAQYDLPDGSKAKPAEYVFTFKTIEGDFVGINEKTFQNWQETYPNLNLWEILEKVANDSYRKSWLKKKNWMYQITDSLAKRNEGVK